MNFKEHESFEHAIIGFSKFLRGNAFLVGHDATIEALKIARDNGFWNKTHLENLYRPIYCNSYEDQERFNHLFEIYFKERIAKFKNKTVIKNQHRTNPIATAVMLGFGDSDTPENEDAKTTTGGNAEEKLRRTDFAQLTKLESDELDELAMKLWKEMSLRLKKKRQFSKRKGNIDIRKTIRLNSENGFEMIRIAHSNRKPQKHKLILLLDISGSMDKYSFYLLKFIWTLKNHFSSLEAFVFSTRLIRITDVLSRNDLESTLKAMKSNVQVWGSGTKIGECLKVFNEKYARRIMQSRNVTLILSDGLDTGDEGALSSEISKIKRKTSKLVWLNPLKGTEGYQPVQKAMKSVVNELDYFQSANTLESLLELEKILVNV